MAQPSHLVHAHEALQKRAWGDAVGHFSRADPHASLTTPDLVRWALAAYLIGRDTYSIEILTRAHQESTDRDDFPVAARCAFWIGLQYIQRGDAAQSGGWFARGARLLDEKGIDCAERGYLILPAALQKLYSGDPASAFGMFEEAGEYGDRFDDADLKAFSRLGRGQALVAQGDAVKGMEMLDEVIVAVSTREVSEVVTGIVYCAVISACQDVFDLARAREWTETLSNWCAAQPDLVPYRGQCLVHRAEIMQHHGTWSQAMEEATRARDLLMDAPDKVSAGMAHYEMGELHRLRGDLAAAEECYRRANEHGHSPQPGLARLRVVQDRLDAAAAAIRRLFDESQKPALRGKLLPAYIEIMLAAGDGVAARVGAEELRALAGSLGGPYLQGLAAYALGAILLAEQDPAGALQELRRAGAAWQELKMPYEAARTRALTGLACRALGDYDTGNMELDAARWAFQELGAEPDLTQVEKLLGIQPSAISDGLTGRELQVLGLVASGKTNREIATDLVISEKTVARHVSNIFVKLGVGSRSAATAYAFKHDLV